MIEPSRCPICQSARVVRDFYVGEREYLRCRSCGLIYLGRIDPVQENAAYETDAYHQLHTCHRLTLREAVFADSLREIARVKKPGRMLDVGCGDGLFLHLAQQRGWEPYGVELSPTACRQAREVHGVNVFCGDVRGAGFSDSFFDVVTLYNVLDHMPFPLSQLIEIHRILKAGGLLVLRVPNGLFHAGAVRRVRRLEPYLVFHLYCFTPRAVVYLLREAGYGEIHVRNSALTPADAYSMSPVGGDRGMQVIKRAIHMAAETLWHASGHSLIVGPSLSVHATKRDR